jgi:hypothetical protein
MNERKWLKLYVGWSDSDWLACLDAGPRLCWPLVLEYVKCMGSGGIVTVRAQRIATFYNVPLEWIESLLSAAVADGAVQLDGQKLTVLNWSDYQGDPTGAERVKRHREAKSRNVTGNDGNALRPLRNGVNAFETVLTAVTTEKEKEKEKETETETETVAHRNGFVRPSPDDCAKVLRGLQRRNWEEDGVRCWNHWNAMGWLDSRGKKINNWRSAVGWWHKDNPEAPAPRQLTQEDLELIHR